MEYGEESVGIEFSEYEQSVEKEKEKYGGRFRYTLLEDIYLGERRSSVSEFTIRPNWRKVPRSPSDFSYLKFSQSSLSDSNYEAWLENYYEETKKEELRKHHVDRQTDTFDLEDEKTLEVEEKKSREIVTSFFQESTLDQWHYRTKYWGPQDVRRHWPLRNKKKEYEFFPAVHPHLNLRSRYGRFHSLLNSAAAVPEVEFRKKACNVIKKAVENLESTEPQLLKILVCDNLINFKWFEFITKVTVLRCICRFLKKQNHLEKVYFENSKMKRMEGIILLCALSRNSGDKIEELHLWNFFDYGENPVLLNRYTKKDKLENIGQSRNLIHLHYLQIFCQFSALTHLSINYGYLANKRGDAILYLRSVVYGRLKELRLLCLESEKPYLTDPCLGVGGWSIKEGVWKRVVDLCPELRVKLVFLDMPKYENIKHFLSKSIPVSYLYISSGIDFLFDSPWDIDSTLLLAKYWYAPTLETLCLHLWHHRDLLDYIIKCKILEEFPNLINFEFIGILEDVKTLESFCRQLLTENYKLKQFLFWVEVTHTNRKKMQSTTKAVKQIQEKYKHKLQAIDIDGDIQMYQL